eukprot:7529903-Pyramimonas_sp.AAC.1
MLKPGMRLSPLSIEIYIHHVLDGTTALETYTALGATRVPPSQAKPLLEPCPITPTLSDRSTDAQCITSSSSTKLISRPLGHCKRYIVVALARHLATQPRRDAPAEHVPHHRWRRG